jgi:threonine dehydrogenase-like Zn-dependent dehydrogenase
VDAAGNEVERLAVGDRVAFLSSNAFAEYDLAEEAHAVKLPETLAKRPFPGKPLGCAMGILRRADLGAGQTLAVIGIGFLGALVTRLAVLAGARVIAISRRSSALELARQLGASHCLPLGDPQQIIREVEQLTGNALCDRVIEVTGAQRALDLAGELTRVRGRLIIAGYHHGLRQINLQLWNWRGLDVINAHERDPLVYVKNMRLALEATQAGQLELELLLTHRFPLERLDAAFQAMEERPDGFLKALVMSWS